MADDSASLLSVIIPVFNGKKFLADAVASVWLQSYRPLEILVIDDGSTDGTADIAAGLEAQSEGRLHFLSQPHTGPSAARNLGLAAARGSVVGFLDADDLWPRQSLACRWTALQSDNALDVVLGRLRYLWMPPDGTGPGELSDDSFAAPSLGCALFRRAAFDRVGELDPRLTFSEDVDWFLRARERGLAMAQLEDVTLLYRQHATNMTRGRAAGDFQMLPVLKASLDRRRQQTGIASALPPIFTHPGRPEAER